MVARLTKKRLAIGWDGRLMKPVHSEPKSVLIIEDPTVKDQGRTLKWQYPINEGDEIQVAELLARHGLTREELRIA